MLSIMPKKSIAVVKPIKPSTLNAIGEAMSKLDPHYVPSSGLNPFLHLLENGKIMPNCFSCFEFNANQQPRPSYRKTVSMIGPHPTHLDDS